MILRSNSERRHMDTVLPRSKRKSRPPEDTILHKLTKSDTIKCWQGCGKSKRVRGSGTLYGQTCDHSRSQALCIDRHVTIQGPGHPLLPRNDDDDSSLWNRVMGEKGSCGWKTRAVPQIPSCQDWWVQFAWVFGETVLSHQKGAGLIILAVHCGPHYRLFRYNIQERSLIRRSRDQRCLIFSFILSRPDCFYCWDKAETTKQAQLGTVVEAVIPALRRPRQEDHKSQASLRYIVRLGLKTQQNTRGQKQRRKTKKPKKQKPPKIPKIPLKN